MEREPISSHIDERCQDAIACNKEEKVNVEVMKVIVRVFAKFVSMSTSSQACRANGLDGLLARRACLCLSEKVNGAYQPTYMRASNIGKNTTKREQTL